MQQESLMTSNMLDNKRVLHVVPQFLGLTLDWVDAHQSNKESLNHFFISRTLVKGFWKVSRSVKIFTSRNSETIGRMNLLERLIRRLGILPPRDVIHFLKIYYLVKPDLIFIHFGYDAYFYTRLIKLLRLRTKLAVRFYGYDVSNLVVSNLWKRRYRSMFKRINYNVVEGGAMAARLFVLGAAPMSVHVVPFSVEPIGPREDKFKEKLKFLVASTLKEKKGIGIALDLLQRFYKSPSAPEFELFIVGDGPQKDILEELSKSCDFDINFMGYMPLEQLRKLMLDFDLFFCTSKVSDNYDSDGGAPVTILHALSAGLPVVGTYVDDIPSLIIDGFNGILFNFADVHEGVKKLEHLFICGDLKKMQENAKISQDNRESMEKNMSVLYERIFRD